MSQIVREGYLELKLGSTGAVGKAGSAIWTAVWVTLKGTPPSEESKHWGDGMMDFFATSEKRDRVGSLELTGLKFSLLGGDTGAILLESTSTASVVRCAQKGKRLRKWCHDIKKMCHAKNLQQDLSESANSTTAGSNEELAHVIGMEAELAEHVEECARVRSLLDSLIVRTKTVKDHLNNMETRVEDLRINIIRLKKHGITSPQKLGSRPTSGSMINLKRVNPDDNNAFPLLGDALPSSTILKMSISLLLPRSVVCMLSLSGN